MKYLAVLQARCGSSRLPNKVLSDIFGVTALERTINRVKKSRYIDELIIVTSYEVDNIEILKIGAGLNIRTFMGSEDDVLDRFYQAVKLIKPEYVIRLTADCPLFDSELLDLAIENINRDSDYISAVSETLADGLDFEIIKYDAFEKSWQNAKLRYEREHVTQYIAKRPSEFIIQDFVSPFGDFGNHRWTLDEKEDYEFICKVYENFKEQNYENFGSKEVLEFLNNNQDVVKINSMYARNEGLKKSILNEVGTDKGV